VPVKSQSMLVFAMFASMWLFGIARAPGGMTAFGNELTSAEQGLVSVATYAPTSRPVTGGNGLAQQEKVETYAGGVVCMETPTDSGTTTTCEAPAALFPY
jgi:hypothetical protein